MSQEARARILWAIERHGVAAVARALGISRNMVMSFALGRNQAASAFLIESRIDRIDAMPPREAA